MKFQGLRSKRCVVVSLCALLVVAGTREAWADDPPPTPFALPVQLAQTNRGFTINVTLNGSFQSPSDFGNTMTIAGTGQAVDPNETPVIDSVSITVGVSPANVNVMPIGQGSYAVTFGNNQTFYLTAVTGGGMRAVASVPTMLAVVDIPPTVTGAVSAGTLGAFAGGVLSALSGVGATPPAPEPCEPSLDTCVDRAVGVCGVGRVKIFDWHCTDGAGSCSFTCKTKDE